MDTRRVLDIYHVVCEKLVLTCARRCIWLTLAVIESNASLVVVLEERIQTSTIDEDVLRVENTHTPSLVILCSTIEDRISKGSVRSERGCSIWVALVVGCFGLDQGHVDVLGVGDLIVVENIVLGGSTPQPDSIL